MINIPASIKDPALRRVLQEIANDVGGGDASIEVQSADPTSSTPGNEGDVIYATGTESIWVFSGTQWDRASSGAEGVTVEVFAYTPASVAAHLTDSSQWIAVSSIFKNNDTTDKALGVHVYEGGVEISQARYSAATYTWRKNGVTFNPTVSQPTGHGNNRRVILIDGGDIADGGTDVFICEVDYT